MAENKVNIGLYGHDRTLGKTFGKAGAEAATFAKRLESVGKRMSVIGATMTRRVTLPIVAGFALAVKAAIDEEKEMALLSQAMKKNAGATNEQVAAVERWVTATQNATGVADGELRPALATLVRATKDTAAAQDILNVALDISAAKGKPVETIALALSKAYQGNMAGLGRLGISYKDAEGKTLTFTQAMQKAVDTYGGAAAKAADTTAGKMAIMKAKMMDAAESLGTALIPAATMLAEKLSKLATWFSGLSKSTQGWIIKIGLAAAAIGPLASMGGKVLQLVSAMLKLSGAIRGVAAASAAANASGVFSGGKWTAAATGVSKYGAAMRAIPWVAAAAAAATLGHYLGGKFQNVMDGTTRKLSGMTQAQVKNEQAMRASRFGGNAAKEFNKASAAAANATTRVRAVGSELTKVGAMHPKPKITVDTGTALSDAANLRAQIAAKFAATIWQRVKVGGGDTGFANGGIATGPKSGYYALLHGTERITPLGGGSPSFAMAGGGGVSFGDIVFEGDVYVRDEAELDAFAARVIDRLARGIRNTSRTGGSIR